ncbi:MAG TPA: hypothetical protein VIO62_01865 [Candidatus Dormibacteraeota bacterium]|jgi:hypothetical protein
MREPDGAVLIAAMPVAFDAMAAPVRAGSCRLFIGKRSDPFYADADGVVQWLLGGQAGNFEWMAEFPFLGVPHPAKVGATTS